MGYRSFLGRCAPSRHPAEDHPQVLIIAPESNSAFFITFEFSNAATHDLASDEISYWQRVVIDCAVFECHIPLAGYWPFR
jgi:hypothetical protein